MRPRVPRQDEGREIAAVGLARARSDRPAHMRGEELDERPAAAIVPEADAARIRARRPVEAVLQERLPEVGNRQRLRGLERRRTEDARASASGRRMAGAAGDEPAPTGREERGAARGIAARDLVAQRAVAVPVRVRRHRDRRQVFVEPLELGIGEVALHPLQRPREVREVADVGAVAAPVERLVPREPEEGLRHHRALHRMPRSAVVGHPELEVADLVERVRLAVGAPHVPREEIGARVDVARRARRLPESRGEVRVVEEAPPARQVEGKRVEVGDFRERLERRLVDDRDARAEAVQRVDAAVRAVDRDARRPLADLDAREAPESTGRDRDEVRRAHSRDEGARAVGRRHDHARIADRREPLGEGHFGREVVEVRIEVAAPRGRRRVRRDDRRLDAHEDAAQVRLEADLVAAVDADHHRLARGQHGDPERRRHQSARVAHARRAATRPRLDDREVVVVRSPRDRARPVEAVHVAPAAARVAADDERRRRRFAEERVARGREVEPVVRRRIRRAGIGARRRADDRLGDDRRLVRRAEERGEDARPVGRERARHVARERQRDRRHERRERIEEVEPVLARDRDERAFGHAREDDVGRLVTGRERRHDAHPDEVDDAHRVGDVIDDPRLGRAARTHRHRLDADRHRPRVTEVGRVGQDVEDLEPRVGGVHGEEAEPVRRPFERVDMRALEVHRSLGVDGDWHGGDRRGCDRHGCDRHGSARCARGRRGREATRRAGGDRREEEHGPWPRHARPR